MKRFPALDFHCHILPAMDDGAESVEESRRMLSEERLAGVTDICFTPHFYAFENSIPSFLNRRKSSFLRIRKRTDGSFLNPVRYYLGAEVHFYEGMADDTLLNMLCCGESNLILIEPSAKKWDSSMFDELDRIKTEAHLQPVIAHVDRYIHAFEDFSIADRLISHGYLIQCNAEFFLDEDYRHSAIDMLSAGVISFVGSDAHNLVNRRVTMRAFLDLLRQEGIEQLFYSASRRGIERLQGLGSF